MQKKINSWQRWDDEVEKFKMALSGKNSTPPFVIRQWRRHMLFKFMQQLSKNILNEHETFDSLIDRIIIAIQFGCGFECVRYYLVDEQEIYLDRVSEGHDPVEMEKLRLPKNVKDDDAANTLKTGEPLLLENASKANLKFREVLNLKGPYVAIPLLVEKKPIGIISANISHKSKAADNLLKFPDYLDHVDTFARHIMASIANRKIFEQRNQQIKQIELVDKLSMIIQAESEKDKLFEALLEQGVNLVKGDSGHLKLSNPITGRLERVADYGADIAPQDIKSKPEGVGFSNYVFENNENLLVDDVSKHPIMKKHITYWQKKGSDQYVAALGKRKSALVVPILTYNNKILGVIDIHGKKRLNQFNGSDKENLLSLVQSVIHAVDKVQQLEKQKELSEMRSELLSMLQQAVEKAHNLNTVLAIIRDSFYKLVNVGNITIVCLLVKDPLSRELINPSVECGKTEKMDCVSCIKDNSIVEKALESGQNLAGKNNLAMPILLKDEVIGVIYLEGKEKIDLNDNEKEILAIILKTAAILITTARNYETKIRQGAALYEAVHYTPKMKGFRNWINPIMEKVMDITGRKNRNFHIVMVEEENDKTKLVVRATSPLFEEGEEIFVEDELLGEIIPKGKSLSGLVVNEKKSKIICDIEKNKALPAGHPEKIPYNISSKRIKSEVGIPLRIKEGEKKETEKVIGVLIIDSLIPNDFHDFDLKFHETIAGYLAIAIRNQQLYQERAEFQSELALRDRQIGLTIILNDFFHDIKNPLQEIKIALNLIRKSKDKAESTKYLNEADRLSLRLLNISEEFSTNFAKTSSERKIEGVRNLIARSLITVERTTGLNLNMQGEFEHFDTEIDCYPVFLELAFRSIINNAVKYSKKLERKKRYLKIDAQLDSENNSVIITLESSTTEPIPEEKIKQIFDPFVRGTDEGYGIGLGLSLAALCIKLHRGKILAENIKNKEAVRFKVTIPKGIGF